MQATNAHNRSIPALSLLATIIFGCCVTVLSVRADDAAGTVSEFPDAAGRIGVIAPQSAGTALFFSPQLGRNGRSCSTCHQMADGMSVSASTVRKTWKQSGAIDPMFDAFDGSNCPSLPQDLESSHSILLNRGAFRIALPWPPRSADGKPIDPEFDIQVVKDPTGCNLDKQYGLVSTNPTISVYRRPRMVANLRLMDAPPAHPRLATFNFKTGTSFERDPDTGQYSAMNLMADSRVLNLKQQVIVALHDHMGAPAPADDELAKLVEFESGIYAAQSFSRLGGPLDADPATAAIGPSNLAKATQIYFGDTFYAPVFRSLDSWRGPVHTTTPSPKDTFLASAARGYDVFFKRPFYIRDAMGISNIGLGNPVKRTCSTCHTNEFVASDLFAGWMDTGTLNVQAPNTVQDGRSNQEFYRSMEDLPLFRITCKPSAPPHPYLGRDILTHDPGRALISGRCSDVGAITIQQIRGLAARAPYFASGSAATLEDLVEFYNRRFDMRLSATEKRDLVNFLSVL